jgi:hypothetical protein
MKSSKKSSTNNIKKKYQTAGLVTPALPKSGPELTYPADVFYGQENLSGNFPTGQPFNMGTDTPIQFPELQSKQLASTNIVPPISFQQIAMGDKTTKEAKVTAPKQPYNQPIDYNSMFTLGLGLTSMGLNQREEQRNRRQLYESIQQRQSQPQYDYNYMYGRTTSGGTEYQPIIKAEMGAQINKRYNTPNSINNVEIEGGEYLQLPDMSTEMAYGPSHSNGGIETSLPEGTRVYSNHLKPMGSKKTFAQMAKKYDNSEYDKILDNKFSKQVDKDTAMIMKQKNQKVLDKLFLDQQLMNGNSNGEPMGMSMAKNGASINNAGFRALPKAVQEQIIANMEYGGYSLPNPLYMQDGAYNLTEDQWDAAQVQGALTNLPRVTQNRITNPGFNTSAPGSFSSTQSPQTAQSTQTTQPAQAKQSTSAKSSNQAVDMNSLPETLRKYAKWDAGRNKFRLDVPSGLSPQELSTIANEAESFGISKLVQSGSNRLKGPASEYSGFYAGLTPQDFEKKIVLEELGEEGIQGLSEQDLRKKAFDLMGVDYSNLDITDAKKLYNDPKFRQNQLYTAFTKYLPQDQFRKELKDDFKLGFEHYDAIKGKPKNKPETPNKPDFGRELTSETPEEGFKTPDFDPAKGQQSGKYYRQPFPLYQTIPNIMGLANAQETFPYAIPEIDSQYIRPQTLNIQSQLQDIDNMGQSAVRAGADPLSAYIAGIGGKEKAFQTKQNFDAQGRMQADVFNAQSKQQSDMFNAQMFDRTYNNLIAQARDAATAEQQAAISNLIEKKAKYDQDENLKSLYLDNLQSAFEIGKDRPYSMALDPKGQPVFNFGALPYEQPQVGSEKNKNKQTSSKTSKKEDDTKVTDVVSKSKSKTNRK